MRWLVRFVLVGTGTAILVILVGFCWLYFYSRDLPDINALAQYAPATEIQVSDGCIGNGTVPSTAISYEAIGLNLRNAISAVEVRETDPGVLNAELFKARELHRRTLSEAISQTLCYGPATASRRQLTELRTAIQFDRHYSRKELFTIYANRVVLGPNLIGVQDGAEFYFRHCPATLSLADAALLAGLIRGPSWLSPVTHPDRALRRRNEVIDAMVENGSVTAAEAQATKNAPLGIAISASTAAAQ